MKTKHFLRVAAALLVVWALAGCAGYPAGIYKPQGGMSQVFPTGTELEVASGGTVDIQSGATFGVDVISETTSGSGVTVDGLTFKDGNIDEGTTVNGDLVLTGTVDVQGGDITLENDETIGNGTNGTIILTADTVTTTAAIGVGTSLAVITDATVGGTFDVDGATTVDGFTAAEAAVFASTVDVQGGDITLQNDETIGNGTNGTILLTADTVTTTAILGVGTSLAVITDATVGGTFGATGAATFASTVDVQGGDITLQNDETIGNGTNGTIVLTADTVTTTAILGVGTDLNVIVNATVGGTLDVQGGDITLQNDETIGNGTNGTVLVTSTEFGVTGKLGGATFSVAAEGGDAIVVTIQLNDIAGTALATSAGCMWYLSEDAAGAAIANAAPSAGIAITTDGLLIEWTADLSGWVISEADGDIDVTLGAAGADTFYLVLVMPDGSLAISAVITFLA